MSSPVQRLQAISPDRQRRLWGHVIAATTTVLASAALVVIVGHLNRNRQPKKAQKKKRATAIALTRSAPPPKKRKVQQQKRRPMRRMRTQAAMPKIASNMASIAVGGFGDSDLKLNEGGQDLLGSGADLSRMVMSSEAVDQRPKVLRRAEPRYPRRAIERNITGKVVLTIVVGADGRVRDAKVLKSSPASVFDQAALDAVKQYVFQPGRYKGRAVAVPSRVVIRFNLG